MTRSGYIMVLITLAVLISAVNTGRNLLYLMFVMLVSLLLVSLVLPGLMVRRLAVRRKAPEFADQFQPVDFTAELENGKWLPAVMLHLTDGNGQGSIMTLEEVAGGAEVRLMYSRVFQERGRHELLPLQARCAFPFGFRERRVSSGETSTVIVYPYYKKVYTLPQALLESRDDTFTTVVKKPGEGLNFLFVREYRPEDGMRRVHWRSSARRGRLMVKEYEQDGKYRYLIALQPDPGNRERYELGVRIAGAMAEYLLSRHYGVFVVPTHEIPRLADP
ncbi:DUF58 domain-containing protein, partial [bacterium]|nr:DUF58 domain-containing protein [candidate division CSSED10-310 bacterium]